MYKDKDKQREANRKAQAKFKAKGITYENGGITVPDKLGPVIPKRGKDIKLIFNNGEQSRRLDSSDVIPAEPETVDSFASDGVVFDKPKRGKDIKVFADLPPAARLAIKELSDNDEEFKRRTAIAINYQHQFPDRYHSTGVV